MKVQKLITIIAAAVCAFAVSNARAQQITTNFVSLTVTFYQQGPTNIVNTAHGTNTVYGPTSVKTYSTSKFIQQVLGPDIGITNFSSAAKLGQTNFVWLVMDGANVVNVSSIFSFNPSDTQIASGSMSDQTFLSAPKMAVMLVGTLLYNDGTVQFSAQGLATGSTTDTVPTNAGVYTETTKVTVMNLVGEGTNQNGKLIVTAKLSGASKAQLSF